MRARVGRKVTAMKARKSSGNVFADIGFSKAEAETLAAKADLVTLLLRTIRLRGLTQKQAAAICGIDQPTLSKVLSGRLGSVTIDRLARWLVRLGGTVEIGYRPPRSKTAKRGSLSVHARM